MNTCKTCRQPNVDEINLQLVNGASLRSIANTIGIEHMSVHRHKNNCMNQLFAEVRETKRAGLLADIDATKERIEALEAEFAQNGNVQQQLVARRLDVIDKEAKLTGAYIKDKDNPATVQETAKLILERLEAKGWDSAEAQAFVRAEYPEELGKVD